MPTIKFQTLGCKVNQYETQSIRERFLRHGFKEASARRISDFCLINTCTVTSSADQKSRSAIKGCINDNPDARIIVTGCMVKNDSDALSKIGGIDLIVSKGFFTEGVSNFCAHTRAFLKIQDGCNNRCSYCKVPLVRGPSRSKPLSDVIKEARALAGNGFKEIVLTGICLGDYGRLLKPRADLIDVIRALEKISGIMRIRLSSIEAGDITQSLINHMAVSKKLCRHLHIPIQSGDDAILKKMKRRYTSGFYLDLIKNIERKVRDVAITTDCLVGFPGESEENFKNTCGLVKLINPLRTHIFPYSPREGTAACKNFRQQISPAVMKSRASRLNELACLSRESYMKRFLGRKMSVLFEGLVKGRAGYWEGYTDNYIRVICFSDKPLRNKLLHLELTGVSADYMTGRNAGLDS